MVAGSDVLQVQSNLQSCSTPVLVAAPGHPDCRVAAAVSGTRKGLPCPGCGTSVPGRLPPCTHVYLAEAPPGPVSLQATTTTASLWSPSAVFCGVS